ncbi:MAG TPA: ATP-binding protein [Haliangiales bacterium]|nr:ATP-binding protein [Haliangiales bacterium]
MTSLDRYRVVERIGQGGMGVVYHAVDEATGQEVALKVMPRAAGRRNLRAEFLALARISHDNIVKVFDYGLTPDGEDWFTMELVRGGPLKHAPPPPDPAFYRLIGGVVRALAFVHARGLVHADVKPSNVLLDDALLAADPTRAAKLADFGLAAASGDPAAAVTRGTIGYAAPEVYAGRLDARSDLYSVGVLLHELVTGQAPFHDSDPANVIRRQRREAAPDPRAVRPDLPAPLAELIVALTDPEPGARPQGADEVLARINEIGGTDFTIVGERPQIDFTGALVGRDRDLAALLGWWERSEGATVLVSGEEGIGKSRLLAELRLRVQLGGGRFTRASAAPRPGEPYGGLMDAVRAVGGDSLAALAGEARADDSRYALAEAVANLLLREPMVLAIDDLGAAEPGTLALLGYLARAAPTGRLLLVLASRGEEPKFPATERLQLPPLDRASVRALIAAALNEEIAEALTPELHRASGGNPAFLERTLAAMVDAGALERRRGRWVLGEPHPVIPVPLDAVQATLARIDALPADARRAVNAAAVLGERFDADALYALAPGADLGELLRARTFEDEGGALAFARGGVRDAVLARLDPDERLRLHAAAADILASRGARAAELAEHHLALGDRDRAVPAALAAADESLVAFDHHRALRFLEAARALAADGKLAETIDERLGAVRAAIGDAAGAVDAYRRALAAADVPTRVRLTRRLAELLRQRGSGDEAVAELMKALAAARAARLPGEEAACHLSLARVRMYGSEYTAAIEHASAGLALARAAGRRDLVVLFLKTRGDIDVFRGDARAALGFLENALAEAGDAGPELMADVYGTRGRAGIHAGDYARAVEALDRSLVIYRKLGRIEQEAKILNNLGAACYFQGLWDRAQTSWERFRSLCERLDDAQELTVALSNLGSLARDRGDFAGALALLERAEGIADRAGRTHFVGLARGNRGDVLARQGDLAGARACYESCQVLFQRLGAREDLIETRRRLVELDLAAGRVDKALDQAIDLARDAREAGLRLEEATLHRLAAAALRQQADLDSADWFIARAQEIAAELGARYDLARIDAEAAEIASKRGRPADADRLLGRAVETFGALGARWDLARARARRRDLRGEPEGTERRLSKSSLEVLLDVTRASGRMDLEKLLEVVLDKILEVTRFERGFILLLDDRGRPTERMRRTAEGFEFAGDEATFSGSIVKQVATVQEPLSIIDIAGDASLREQGSIVALGLRSVMCAPMRRQGRVTGIIYVDSRRLADEDAADLALLEALASQAAIAIENARLVDEEQRKTELMAILAHEIRNPLAGILGFSELFPEESAEMPPKFSQLMGRIHQDAQRLKRLVDNILELARLEAGKVEWTMTPVSVAGLLADARTTFEGIAAKKQVALAVSAPADLPDVLGNGDRLFQVLSNLVGNAIKFSPEKGTIQLSARLEPQVGTWHSAGEDLDPWLPTGLPRAYVRIDVADDGPGIPADKRHLLFEKFAQGEKRSHGVGLGLYISREIVKRHGGAIWAEGEPGGGAVFSFRIPVAR